MREYIRKEYVGPVLRFLTRIMMGVGVILLLDVIGLWIFLFSRGQWDLISFKGLLTILLLLEGSLIGAAGGFMFFGFGEYRVFGQSAINPVIVRDQAKRWGERRLSQQKLGLAMLIAGVILIFLFLLVGLSTSL